jgi:hypothetical protein
LNFSENGIDRLSTAVEVIRPAVGASKFWFGKHEARMVEQVERVPPELDVGAAEDREPLRQRAVEIEVAWTVEDSAAAVAIRVGGRRDEVARVIPEIDRRIVELAGPDAVRPAGGAVVDAGPGTTPLASRTAPTIVPVVTCAPSPASNAATSPIRTTTKRSR